MSNENNENPPSLDDFLNTPLKKTGVDLPSGSYPATFFAWGKPWMIENVKFRKEGQPSKKPVIEARFAVRAPDGSVQLVEYLMSYVRPDGANRLTTMYKMLRSMKGGDSKYYKQDNSGDFADGINPRSFLGANAVIQISKNKDGFPKIDSVNSPIDGLKYPTQQECKSLETEVSEGVPF